MELVWKDRKRTFLGLPLSFTVYSLDGERLFIKTGVLSVNEDEVRLYRIKDISLRRSFSQRLLGLGTIHCCSSDATLKEFDIRNIKKPREVRELLSQMIEAERQKKRVRSLESLDNRDDVDDGDDFDGDHDL